MKKIVSTLFIFFVMLINHCMYVNAGHQHIDSCYTIQGAHTHSGDTVKGGACYGNAIYHAHTGDALCGGACYEKPVYHTHVGDVLNGGACYETPIYHKHIGESAGGDGCYNTPVYHIHTGDSTKSGGCYTKALTCGGNIASNRVDIICNITKAGVLKTETWPCGCGGTVTQFCFSLTTNSECEAEHGAYYEIECNVCDKSYTSGDIGQHTGFKTVYSCGVCGAKYNTAGKCSKVKSYGLSCGKTTNTVEKYDLSCGKNADTIDGYELSCMKDGDTIDGYELSCGKNKETIEGYQLSCTKEETSGERVLICKLEESKDQPNIPSVIVKPSIPDVSVKPNTPETPKESDISKEPLEESIEKNKNDAEEETENDVFEDGEEDNLNFEVECGLMADGIWVKILPLSEENLAKEPYSWDRGETWETSNKNIFTKDGTYYLAIKSENGKIKAKKLDIDATRTDYAVVTDYNDFLTEIEYREMIKQAETTDKIETFVKTEYTEAEYKESGNIAVLKEDVIQEETKKNTTQDTLATTAKVAALAALFFSGESLLFVLFLKRKK